MNNNNNNKSQYKNNLNSGIETKYEVIKRIGSGGSGVVVLCEHKKNKERKAIKTITVKKKMMNRVLGEINMMSALKHFDNIVPIEQVYASRDNKRLFIVMPYYELGDLRKFVYEHQPISNKMIASIVYQMASLILSLEKESIIHRDIKMDNFLIYSFNKNKNQVKIDLGDFGLAKAKTNYSQTQTQMIGTLLYMSPEMYGIDYDGESGYEKVIEKNSKNVTIDQRSDIWSCGVILYQLLSNDFSTNISQQLMSRNKEKLNQILLQTIHSQSIKRDKKLIHLLFETIEPNIKNRITPTKFYQKSKEILSNLS
jgi:serine/threonine protein kinase